MEVSGAINFASDTVDEECFQSVALNPIVYKYDDIVVELDINLFVG